MCNEDNECLSDIANVLHSVALRNHIENGEEGSSDDGNTQPVPQYIWIAGPFQHLSRRVECRDMTVEDVCAHQLASLNISTNFQLVMDYQGRRLPNSTTLPLSGAHRDEVYRLKFFPMNGGRPIITWNLTGMGDDRCSDFNDLASESPIAIAIQETHLTDRGQERYVNQHGITYGELPAIQALSR